MAKGQGSRSSRCESRQIGLEAWSIISEVKKDCVVWWLIDIIADRDLMMLGFVLAAVALIAVLVRLL
jgi:hypothetical protein